VPFQSRIDLKIAHTSITVKDLERSLDFYCGSLGLKLVSRREIPENKAEIAFVRGEDQDSPSLELTFWREKKDWTDGDQLDHIALSVPDVVKSVEELRKKGVEIVKEPYSLKGSTNKIAFIKDPNGIWLELVTGH
jgi:lactoylglutathione lyase